jgi:hypothetical protein
MQALIVPDVMGWSRLCAGCSARPNRASGSVL